MEKDDTYGLISEFVTFPDHLVAYIHFHQPNALNGCKTPLLWVT
jgi:hypothetical protein